MFSLDPEVASLRDEGVLDPAAAAKLIALERREVVSLYGELRFLTWGGVMLIASGVGILVSKNLDKIGPLAIALAIATAAVACYAYSEWRRRAATRPDFKHLLIDDFILLLAALLASADVGFIENQWHILGANWQRHFLFLAVLHAVTAYVFDSRLVLSLSVSSFAAFLGIERRFDTVFSSTMDIAIRAFACAAMVFAWRAIDAGVRRGMSGHSVIASRRSRGGRRAEGAAKRGERPQNATNPAFAESPFSPVFDHFAANLAFWGAVIVTADGKLYVLGFLLTVVFAVLATLHGLRTREELFVIYAWVYGLIALNILAFRLIKEPVFSSLLGMFTAAGAIVGLIIIHFRMREACQ